MQVPVEWKQVLQDIQQVFPGAKIAGGALRDLFFERPIKDVDIFCNIDEMPQGFDSMLMEVFPQLVLVQGAGSDKYLGETSDRPIYGIYQFTDAKYKYEIIVTIAACCDVDLFDLSICQITFDGDTLHMTDKFAATVETGCIEVCNINRADRQEDRIKRILEKYPDFTILSKEEDSYDFN